MESDAIMGQRLSAKEHILDKHDYQILNLLTQGADNKAIAEKLFVSPGTIKTHTLNIYRKMDVSNRTSAIMKAIELNWFV